MLGYYLQLAAKSFARNPGLTALMVLAIALGISACVTVLTIYHTMTGNPIWWKDDRLYAVTIDAWDPGRPIDESRPQLPPPLLTYRDATAVYQWGIPSRKVMTYKADGVVAAGNKGKGVREGTRFTTADFFTMFDVNFRYGSGWTAAADAGPEAVIVLSSRANEILFGGANSIGRIVSWQGQPFRIVGVIGDWNPQPKYYDLANGPYSVIEAAFLPWAWGRKLESRSNGPVACWRAEKLDTFRDFLGSECVWLQMWVELPDARARERMQAALDDYWTLQHKAGRMQRPRNNRLTRVSQWLEEARLVGSDTKVLIALAFAFFAVCLINTVGLLLAKFLNAGPATGLRRALGASHKQVFAQHFTEAGLIATAGALLGLLMSALSLRGLRALNTISEWVPVGGASELMHFDATSILLAMSLAVAATLAAGVYPAWRIGRLPPALYLKSQ